MDICAICIERIGRQYQTTGTYVRPDIRSICNRDMLGHFVRIDVSYIHTQFDDAVATVRRTNQRILIDTGLADEALRMSTCQTELDGFAEADIGIDVLDGLLLEDNIQIIDTIQVNACRQRVIYMEVRTVLVRSVEPALEVRRPWVGDGGIRELANFQCITEDVRLVNLEVEYDRAVASELIPHRDGVDTGRAERIDLCGICSVEFLPRVGPVVRDIAIGDRQGLMGCLDAITCLKVQLDDTVTTIEGRDGIVVNALQGKQTRGLGVIVMVRIEAILGAFADSVVNLGEVLLMVIHIQIIDAIEAIEQSRQRVNQVVSRVVTRQSELRLMSVRPDIERVFVLEFTNTQGIAEMIGGVNKQV